MEAFILVAAILVVLPVGFVFGIWLLLSWYRMRGRKSSDGPSFRPVDLDRLWFPKTALEKAIQPPKDPSA